MAVLSLLLFVVCGYLVSVAVCVCCFLSVAVCVAACLLLSVPVAVCGCCCVWRSEGKKTNKGAGHVSEDSGDDLRDHARNEALDSFAVDLGKNVPAGGAKKKAGGKKGTGKGKKK